MKAVKIQIKEWTGRWSDCPPHKSLRLLRTMMENMFEVFESRGLNPGIYKIVPEATSVRHNGAYYQVHLKSPSNSRPGLFLGVTLDRQGGAIAVRIIPMEQDVQQARENFERVWHECVGTSHNLKFSLDGKPLNILPLNEKSPMAAVQAPLLQAPLPVAVESDRQIVSTELSQNKIAPNTELPLTSTVNAETPQIEEFKGEPVLCGLTGFLKNETNQTLLLAQLAEIAVQNGDYRVDFRVIERSIFEEWSCEYSVTTAGISRVLLSGRNSNLLKRHRVGKLTMYSLTVEGVNILLKNHGTDDTAQKYLRLAGSHISLPIESETQTVPATCSTQPPPQGGVADLILQLGQLRDNYLEYKELIGRRIPELVARFEHVQAEISPLRLKVTELQEQIVSLQQQLTATRAELQSKQEKLFADASLIELETDIKEKQCRADELRQSALIFESIRDTLVSK